MASPPDTGPRAPARWAPWSAAARALGRLELLQGVVLLVVAAVAVGTSLAFGRAVLAAHDDEARERARAQQLVDIRDAIRQQEIAYLQRVVDGKPGFDAAAPLTLAVGRAAIADLARQEEATDPAELVAISDTLSGLDAISAVAEAVPLGRARGRDAAGAARVAAAGPGVVDAVTRWVRIDRAQAAASAARSDTLIRRMMVWLPVAVGIVAFVGLVAWRLFDRARSRVTDLLGGLAEEQSALREIATSVAAEEDPERIFPRVARAAAELLRIDSAAVVRFDGEVGRAVGVFIRGRQPPGIDGLEVSLTGSTATAAVRRTGRTGVVDDYGRYPDDPICRMAAAAGFRTGIAAPVRLGGRVWGCVGASGRGQLPRDAADRLERLADLVALMIENAESRRRLAAQAATDPLTGLANHRTFQERLHAEVEHAMARERGLSLVLFDIDHFKEVNDAHGHQVGDKVLLEVSRVLSREARRGELVARVGGEELAWILPDCDALDAWQAAERVRKSIAETRFPTVGTVTVSAGVCDLEQATGRAPDLFRLADGALYWAKAHGRNATYRYTPDVVGDLSAAERAERLSRTQAFTALQALARAVDARDESTRRHSERVAAMAALLAGEIGWSRDRVDRLRQAGLMHDVGKLAVPDAILLKPGPLDPDEYEIVKEHAARGAEIVTGVLGTEQVSWVRGHHERWDGRGYPDALAADAIPDGARLLALADAWDVMTSMRPYSDARSVDQALAECRSEAGRQFWDAAVDALESLAAGGRLPAAHLAHRVLEGTEA
ncbi:MAG: diguanylate cyclase [Actinomycetota bacterium]